MQVSTPNFKVVGYRGKRARRTSQRNQSRAHCIPSFPPLDWYPFPPLSAPVRVSASMSVINTVQDRGLAASTLILDGLDTGPAGKSTKLL